jgi:serine protease Do
MNGKKLLIIAILITAISSYQCSKSSMKGPGDSGAEGKKIYTESNYNNNGAAQQDVAASRQNAITRAVQKCRPAIVGINVTEVVSVQYRDPFFDLFQNDPLYNQFFGGRSGGREQKYQVQGLGSGFIISDDGYILTNNHVAGNASKIIITMTDGKKYDAEIIGTDKTSDVTLLKIDAKNLPFLKLANSDYVIPGEWAIAFGNPFGLFDLNAKPTVTVGVVSNTELSFTQEDRVYRNMIQTDAAISSGNSGGPLVNADGEVIGMNTVIFSTAQNASGAGSIGIGFAIPINRIKGVVDQFQQHKKIDRNYYIGMDVRELDEKIARYLGLKQTDGVVVVEVQRNSPADEAKIEPGDIIENIDGYKIDKYDDYVIVVKDAVTGQKLSVELLRDNKKINTTLVLKPRNR